MSDTLYWHVSGQGPDLVLVHGWGMNGAVWQQTVDALEADFRVHVVDLTWVWTQFSLPRSRS